MGQGQEIHARNMISDSIANGGWVLLQNMHLSLPFCTEAMDALSDSEDIHTSFRMWITTEVHPQFPIALLQVNNPLFEPFILWIFSYINFFILFLDGN